MPILLSAINGILRWQQIDSEHTYTTVSIERATSYGGTYAEVTTQSSSDNTYFDKDATSSSYYRIRFYDSVNLVYSGYSNIIKAFSSVAYLDVDEARSLLKLNSSEYDDNAMYRLILIASDMVDENTGRTWKGIQSVSNEAYDGDDGYTLILNNTDVHSVDSLRIRETGDSEYTTVTPNYVHLYSEGMLRIDEDAYPDVEVENFPKGFKTVLVSYKHGNEKPTQTVKKLTLLYLQQLLNEKEERNVVIKELVDHLRFKGVNFL
jgi:hypothetical protein